MIAMLLGPRALQRRAIAADDVRAPVAVLAAAAGDSGCRFAPR